MGRGFDACLRHCRWRSSQLVGIGKLERQLALGDELGQCRSKSLSIGLAEVDTLASDFPRTYSLAALLNCPMKPAQCDKI